MKNNEVKLGKYKHHKGDIVEVIGKSLHSETLEEFVTYIHITGARKDEPYYWVRPIEMFFDIVLKDGQLIPRFEYLDQ